MKLKLVVRREASAETTQATAWYEEQATGVGDRFLKEVGATLAAIKSSPSSFPAHRGAIRRAHVKGFPYGVFFETIGDRLIVLAVVHLSRNPRWLSRVLRERE